MNNVSPVTEIEMKQFFDRIATTFVGLSAQSHELDRLKAEMQAMSDRLNEMAKDNANLRKEISDTYELVSGVERERDEAKAKVQQVETQNEYLRSHNKELQEAIDALNTDVRRLTDSITVANRETEQARAEAKGLAYEVDKARQSRDYWRDRAEGAEQARTKAEAETTDAKNHALSVEVKLASVQAKLAEVTSIFAPTEQAGPDPMFSTDYNVTGAKTGSF